MSGAVHVCAGLSPQALRCAEAALPGLERAAAAAGARVLLGLPSPPEWGALAPRFGGCVLVPLLGPDRPTAAHAGPVRAAGALVAAAADEVRQLTAFGALPPVVRAALPVPPALPAAGVIADAARPEVAAATRAWEAEHGALPADGPPVVWAAARGAAPQAALRCAAADRAAVVALPGCADREALVAAGALPAASVAEVVAVTALLRGAPALHDAVARRVRHAAAGAPAGALVEAVLEAAVLAAEGG